MNANRGIPDAGNNGIAADQVTYKYRALELEGIYGNRHDAALCPASCNDTARKVDLRHQPAAKYITRGIRISRHGHYLDSKMPPVRQFQAISQNVHCCSYERAAGCRFVVA